ncbi:MerR family transcriptional regulator [Microbacterium gorillae]|uniref:MerR family transcriptional regulator n=1 Tax=Microbacterium gorillae TaxID=1231063 RepID=UPI00058E5460|nr:MerR family transcriptional regulator [Microbacterium gorillae]
MRISELSDQSGVSVASIKFYVREGLLAGGDRTTPTRTEYDEAHLARLRLIRALIEVGGLDIATTRDVLRTIDNPDVDPIELRRVAHRAVPHSDVRSSPESIAAVMAVVEERGWLVGPDNPGVHRVARALDAYEASGQTVPLDRLLAAYADAALIVGEADIEHIGRTPSPADTAKAVILGTVVGEQILAGLRLMTQEHVGRSLAARAAEGGHAADIAQTEQ